MPDPIASEDGWFSQHVHILVRPKQSDQPESTRCKPLVICILNATTTINYTVVRYRPLPVDRGTIMTTLTPRFIDSAIKADFPIDAVPLLLDILSV